MKRGKGPGERMEVMGAAMRANLSHLYRWAEDAEDFREIRVKTKEDGTMLVIAKGHMEDGTPSVAFGVGYGLVGALMGIDATISGGHWKVDKPWQPKK